MPGICKRRSLSKRLAVATAFALFTLCAWLLHTAWQSAELVAPAGSYQLVDRHGQWLADFGGPENGQYGYWPLQSVPERVALATLALEDARFDSHPGVDGLAVLRAMLQNFRCGCVRSGASTIAMQTVRLQNPQPRTLAAKAMEALTAVTMTLRHGREAVLKHYLRHVPYGNGSHGIAHAARMYLDKPVVDLSWAEIALLSAIPRAPHRNNPLTVSGHANAVARAERILDYLHAIEVMDAAELDLAQRQLPRLRLRHPGARPPEALHAVLDLERRLLAQGWAPGVVRASLDLGVQRRVSRLAGDWLDSHRQMSVERVAVLVVDRQDMAVRALVGSGDYLDPQGGALDFTGIARSPGSVIKPFIYAQALERGLIAPDTVLWDEPFEVPGIRNADRRHLGAMLPRQALANSRNVPAVSLVQQLGLETSYGFLQQAGLHDDRRPAAHYGAGLAIGTLPMTLRDVVRAYGMLANDGKLQPLAWLADEADSPSTSLISETTARQVTQFLADPMVRLPSFSRMGALEYPFEVAVKTGTSQDVRDAWTVAYTAEHIVGVWAGRADGKGMQRGLRGISAAALARSVMLDLYQRAGGTERTAGFAPPSGHQAVTLCLDTGQPAGPGCTQAVTEWLPAQDQGRRRAGRVAAPVLGNGLIDDAVGLRIRQPADGTVYFRNPETPGELQTLRFALDNDELDGQVVWHVNGRPHAVLAAGESLQLPMQPGQIKVFAQRVYRPERSAEVEVTVR